LPLSIKGLIFVKSSHNIVQKEFPGVYFTGIKCRNTGQKVDIKGLKKNGIPFVRQGRETGGSEKEPLKQTLFGIPLL
jgi:hypothetical protein